MSETDGEIGHFLLFPFRSQILGGMEKADSALRRSRIRNDYRKCLLGRRRDGAAKGVGAAAGDGSRAATRRARRTESAHDTNDSQRMGR